jgi:hypothetical protein
VKLFFIDEVKNQKDNRYFGVCCVCVEHAFYQSMAADIENIFTTAGWRVDQYEFKGSFMFSDRKGDVSVSIDKRIEMVQSLLALDVARKNSKLGVEFRYNFDGDGESNYMNLVGECLKKVPKPHKGAGKKLCSVFVDHHDGYDQRKLRDLVLCPALSKKGWMLIEDVHFIGAWWENQRGMTMCDILAYLASWVSLVPDLSTAPEAMASVGEMSPFDQRKYARVTELLRLVKKLNILRV